MKYSLAVARVGLNVGLFAALFAALIVCLEGGRRSGRKAFGSKGALPSGLGTVEAVTFGLAACRDVPSATIVVLPALNAMFDFEYRRLGLIRIDDFDNLLVRVRASMGNAPSSDFRRRLERGRFVCRTD